MAKTCATCHAENRDDAQFCRACGTSFVATPTPPHDPTATGMICAECGFENKPGIRYCAKCGAGLASQSERPRDTASASPPGASSSDPRAPTPEADGVTRPPTTDSSVATAVDRAADPSVLVA